MQSEFRIETSSKAGASVIRIFGELDLATSPALEEELDRVAADDGPMIIVDLAELEFMDSTGLSVLVRAHQRAEEGGQRFGLVNASQQVLRLLTLTGVKERLVLEEIPELDDVYSRRSELPALVGHHDAQDLVIVGRVDLDLVAQHQQRRPNVAHRPLFPELRPTAGAERTDGQLQAARSG